jgi:uncharacterized RDD family membrane protein YckC
MQAQELEYVGFWPRCVASLIDSVLLMFVLMPILAMLFSWSYLDASIGATSATWSMNFSSRANSWTAHILVALVVLAFWYYKQSTPGKMLFKAQIVDAKTGQKMSPGQAFGRYLAYAVSVLPFCLGLIWVAFDSKKQGWHDKLAGTVVVRPKKSKPLTEAEPVVFSHHTSVDTQYLR